MLLEISEHSIDGPLNKCGSSWKVKKCCKLKYLGYILCHANVDDESAYFDVCGKTRKLHCEPKKHTKMFLSYLPQNPGDSEKTMRCPE